EETGLAEAARELGVKHLPNVARNVSGTPLISSMFELARENCRSEFLCIINADIILLPDFVEAVMESRSLLLDKREQAPAPQNFVLLSQRWDVDITTPIDFSDGWQNRLSSIVHRQGTLHRPAGSDFFLFPLSSFLQVPAFTIGRAGWDNWMIYHARKNKWPVIDCTPSLMLIHQNHDYSHLPDGKIHHTHPDTDENIRLAGGQAAVRYTILDSTHQLRDGKLTRPRVTSLRFARKAELFLRKVFFFLPEDKIENVVRPQRWAKRIQKIVNRKS
ncbi:MAG: hypothetical protein Q7R83_02125, partial [bacterium]|nr:hypothetical protein [bacterium]